MSALWYNSTLSYIRPPDFTSDEEWKAALIKRFEAALANTTIPLKMLEIPDSGTEAHDR